MANTFTIASLLEDGSKVLNFSYTVTEQDLLNGTLTLHTDVDGMDGKIDAEKDLRVQLEAARRTATAVWTWDALPHDGKPEPGDKITGKILITNTGNITISDAVLDFSGTPVVIESGTGYSGSGTKATLDSIAPEGTCTVNVSYTVTAYDGTVQSSATLTATEINVTANAETITLATQPELDITLTGIPASVYAGQTVTFTVVAKDTVEDTVARNAEVEVELPDIFENLSGEAQIQGTTATFTVGDLAYGEDETLTLTASVKSTAALGSKQCEATFTADNCTEATDTCQIVVTDSVTVNVNFTSTPHAAHSDRYVTGDTVTGTVTVANASADQISDLTVTCLAGGNDILGGKDTEIISIEASGNKVYSFTHVVTEAEAKSGTYTVTVQVTADNIDKQDSKSVTVAEGIYSVDVQMADTTDAAPYGLGATVTGTITIRNDGTYDLSNLSVSVTPESTEVTE